MTAKDLAEYCATPPAPEEGNPPAPESPNLGTVEEDLFFSFLPESPDNAICIYDTGGWAPDPDLSRRDPSFQFLIRGENYDAAMGKALTILNYFCNKSNFYIGTDFVHKVTAGESAPSGVLGRDGNERDRFVLNFTFIVH